VYVPGARLPGAVTVAYIVLGVTPVEGVTVNQGAPETVTIKLAGVSQVR